MRQVITRAQVNETLETLSVTYAVQVDGDTFLDDYSGRGMRGTGCVGFVVGERSLTAVGAALAEVLAADYPTLLHYMIINACVDTMGLDVIVYFPGVILASEYTTREGEESAQDFEG